MDRRMIDGQAMYSDKNKSEEEIRNGLAVSSDMGS